MVYINQFRRENYNDKKWSLSDLELATFCLFEMTTDLSTQLYSVLEYLSVTCCYKFDAEFTGVTPLNMSEL